MSAFLLLKLLHVTCVCCSFTLFNLRVYWKWQQAPQLQLLWVKRWPHITDSILLSSGVAMAVLLGQCPFVNAPWLTMKTSLLLFYIVVGMLLFRVSESSWRFWSLWLLAQSVFFYMVWVAIFKQPLPLNG